MDQEVLYMCAESRDSYYRYRKYVKPHVVEKETNNLLEYMGDYYKGQPTISAIKWDAFGAYICGDMMKRLTPESFSLHRNIVKKMETYTPSTSYDEVIKNLIESDYIARLMEECAKVRDGESDLEHIHTMATQALRDVERYVDKDELFVIPDITSVVDRISSTGYEWRLTALNRSLGLLRPGDFVIVAARVEVGKTTFLASEASYLAPQLPMDRPIVWVNNEEKSDTVFFRVVQATLGMTTKEIMADSAGAMSRYGTIMGGSQKRILVTDGNTNHVQALESMFKDVNPGLIIFDQLDKVSGFQKEDREDLRLGRLYKWARELAREYGPVIAASQLTAGVEELKDPPFIGLDALRGSKTDKPGEADAVITIGKFKEPKSPEEALARTINVPKNKLPGGGAHQIESERHGQYIVSIDPLRARYE